jgi:catechol 2,3-dioxygenase-like lactoylglutathione lyase family enzyme
METSIQSRSGLLSGFHRPGPAAVRSPWNVGGACHPRGMLDHLGIQTADPEASAAFYDAVLASLGHRRMLQYGPVIGYGTEHPQFWISPSETEGPARESHIAFTAPDRETDVKYLARKVSAGADFAVTQFFFDAEAYFRLVDLAREAGCGVPIIPGIMPVTNVRQQFRDHVHEIARVTQSRITQLLLSHDGHGHLCQVILIG